MEIGNLDSWWSVIRSNLLSIALGSCTELLWFLFLLSPASGLCGSAYSLCQVPSAVWAQGLPRCDGHPGSAAHTEHRHPSVLHPQHDGVSMFLKTTLRCMEFTFCCWVLITSVQPVDSVLSLPFPRQSRIPQWWVASFLAVWLAHSQTWTTIGIFP